MNFRIVKPINQILNQYIEYFLFISSGENDEIKGYTTVPNTNVCLSIYKHNEIKWDRDSNNCSIQDSGQFGVSKIYGWHQKPFNVKLLGHLDQVCIIFRPVGLANFTQNNLDDLDKGDDPFTEIFGRASQDVKCRLFEELNLEKRVIILESFLIQKLNLRKKGIVDLCLEQITSNDQSEDFCIHGFCRQNKIHESTLYRNFKSAIGESVKKFYGKHRFRTALKSIWQENSPMTFSYLSNYYDQSHFIKEVKKYSGYAPGQLIRKIKSVEKELLLVG